MDNANANQPSNEIEQLLPLYALGGLNATETAQVEALLASRPDLRTEVEQMSDAAALLAETPPAMVPPTQIRQAVMDHVRGSAPSTRTGRPRVIAAPPPVKKSWLSRLRIMPTLAGLGIVVLLGFMSLQLFTLQRDMRDLQAQNAALTQSLTSQGWLASYLLDENVQRFAIASTDQGSAANGQFLMRANGTQGLLVTSELPALAPDQTYQFWVIDSDEGKAVSAGIFDIGVDGNGLLRVDLDDPIATFEAIGVSVEPAGGSPEPSDEIVMLAELN